MDYIFDNYVVNIDKYIIEISDNNVLTRYKTEITETNKVSSMSLDVFYNFMLKCFNKESNFNFKINKKKNEIEVEFHGIFNDFFEIKHSLVLNEIVMTENEKLVQKLRILEKKIKELEKNTVKSIESQLKFSTNGDTLKLSKSLEDLKVEFKQQEQLVKKLLTESKSTNTTDTLKLSKSLEDLKVEFKQQEQLVKKLLTESKSTNVSEATDTTGIITKLNEFENKINESVKKVPLILKHLKQAEDDIKELKTNKNATGSVDSNSIDLINSKLQLQERSIFKEIKNIKEQSIEKLQEEIKSIKVQSFDKKVIDKLQEEVKSIKVQPSDKTVFDKLQQEMKLIKDQSFDKRLFDKLQLDLKNKDNEILQLKTKLNEIENTIKEFNKINTTINQQKLMLDATRIKLDKIDKLEELVSNKMNDDKETSSEPVLIYRNHSHRPFRYETITNTDTEVDLSKYDNSMIIWHNLSKLVNLETLIINDTYKTAITYNRTETIYQLDNWCCYTTDGNKLCQSNTFDVMNFYSVKTLKIVKKNGTATELGIIPNIPLLENLILENFNVPINIESIKIIKTLKKVQLINTKITNLNDFKKYCTSNKIILVT
jgi:hypothetical protein